MKSIFVVFLISVCTGAFAQGNDTTLRKSIVSAEIGLFSAWLNYERQLSGLFSLKTELGLGVYFGQDLFYGSSYTEFTPIVVAEPRYYYNFYRRVARGRKTSYNASDYLALTVSYFLNPFVRTNAPYHIRQHGYWVMPKWGIKRTVGRRMNFEAAFGGGLIHTSRSFRTGVGLDLRFGYNIK